MRQRHAKKVDLDQERQTAANGKPLNESAFSANVAFASPNPAEVISVNGREATPRKQGIF